MSLLAADLFSNSAAMTGIKPAATMVRYWGAKPPMLTFRGRSSCFFTNPVHRRRVINPIGYSVSVENIASWNNVKLAVTNCQELWKLFRRFAGSLEEETSFASALMKFFQCTSDALERMLASNEEALAAFKANNEVEVVCADLVFRVINTIITASSAKWVGNTLLSSSTTITVDKNSWMMFVQQARCRPS